MLCPTCAKRETCQSICEDLQQELARIEKPLREVLRPPRQLEKISDVITAIEFGRTQFTAQEAYEDREQAEAKHRLYLAVNSSLDELTPKQKECVLLRYWEDMSPMEIAEELGISRQVVLRRLDAAQKIIKKYLTESLKTGCNFAQYE